MELLEYHYTQPFPLNLNYKIKKEEITSYNFKQVTNFNYIQILEPLALTNTNDMIDNIIYNEDIQVFNASELLNTSYFEHAEDGKTMEDDRDTLIAYIQKYREVCKELQSRVIAYEQNKPCNYTKNKRLYLKKIKTLKSKLAIANQELLDAQSGKLDERLVSNLRNYIEDNTLLRKKINILKNNSIDSLSGLNIENKTLENKLTIFEKREFEREKRHKNLQNRLHNSSRQLNLIQFKLRNQDEITFNEPNIKLQRELEKIRKEQTKKIEKLHEQNIFLEKQNKNLSVATKDVNFKIKFEQDNVKRYRNKLQAVNMNISKLTNIQSQYGTLNDLYNAKHYTIESIKLLQERRSNLNTTFLGQLGVLNSELDKFTTLEADLTQLYKKRKNELEKQINDMKIEFNNVLSNITLKIQMEQKEIAAIDAKIIQLQTIHNETESLKTEASELNLEIETSEENIKLYENEYNEKQMELSNISLNLNSMRENADNLQRTIQKQQSKIKENESYIEQLIAKNNVLEISLEEKNKEIADVAEAIDQIENNIKQIENNSNVLYLQNELVKQKQQVKELNHIKTTLREKANIYDEQIKKNLRQMREKIKPSASPLMVDKMWQNKEKMYQNQIMNLRKTNRTLQTQSQEFQLKYYELKNKN